LSIPFTFLDRLLYLFGVALLLMYRIIDWYKERQERRF
jgi:hypothetical protein